MAKMYTQGKFKKRIQVQFLPRNKFSSVRLLMSRLICINFTFYKKSKYVYSNMNTLKFILINGDETKWGKLVNDVFCWRLFKSEWKWKLRKMPWDFLGIRRAIFKKSTGCLKMCICKKCFYGVLNFLVDSDWRFWLGSNKLIVRTQILIPMMQSNFSVHI